MFFQGRLFSRGQLFSQGLGSFFSQGFGVIFFPRGQDHFFPGLSCFPAGSFAPLHPQAFTMAPGRAGGGDAEGTALHHRDGAGFCQILEDPGGIKAAATK